MAASNINRVVLTGNLTRDPELRSLPSGMSVCSLRIASNSRRKENGEWVDKPNYFSVTVWGAQGENASRFLSKGRPVAIDGRLEWREWQDQSGNKREAIEIVADSVQFLGGREDGPGGGGGYNAGGAGAGAGAGNGFTPHSDVPTDSSDFAPQPVGARNTAPADDDIPF
jgi:single-strand DNA-binding protein